MPKVGIMAEVSVDIMNDVVIPAKAEKRFNRLISDLLSAYYESETVRSIVDGSAEMSHLEGLSSLQEQLMQASQSVEYMGMIGDSVQMSLDSAKNEFSNIDGVSPKEIKSGIGKTDLEDFKKEVLEEQRQFMSDIRSLLSEVVSGHSRDEESSPKDKEVVQSLSKSIEVKEEEVKKEEVTSGNIQPVVTSPVSEEEFGDFDIVEEGSLNESDEPSGDDLLASLLGDSNSFSFGGS